MFLSTNYRCIQIVVFPGDESSVSTSVEMQIMSSWLKPAVKSILISPLFAHCECCHSAVIKRVGCFTCVCVCVWPDGVQVEIKVFLLKLLRNGYL